MSIRLMILTLFSVLCGCATVNPMAFDKSSKTVDVSSKSVLLMTLNVSRSDDSRYVLHPRVVFIEKPNANNKADRQNFKVDENADKITTNGGQDIYLLRMALEPGQYQLKGVM